MSRIIMFDVRTIFFTMTKLSKWFKGNLKNNVKESLEAIIENLLKLKPLIKKNKKQALPSLLRTLMKNDETVRKKYKYLNVLLMLIILKKEKY